MRKNITKLLVLSMMVLFSFTSCNDEVGQNLKEKVENNTIETKTEYELLATFSQEDLNKVALGLGKIATASKSVQNDNLFQPTNSVTTKGENGTILGVNAYKVSTLTPHPNGSGELIKASGVALIPVSKKTPYRIIYTTQFTYTSNAAAPSVFFKNVKLDNFKEFEGITNYLSLLQAREGFAVFLPDYLGFGDSLGKCFLPFALKDVHNKSNFDFYMAAKHVLATEKYNLKERPLLQGYSLGAYSAMNFSRYLEEEKNIEVKFTSVGGTPAKLDQFIVNAKSSKKHPYPFFFPYAFFGWSENGFLKDDISLVLKEPHASSAKSLYDGSQSMLVAMGRFPKLMSKFLTDDFIKDDISKPESKFYGLYKACVYNSLTPWKNKGGIQMYHGRKDDGVYFKQAYDYYKEHKAKGGNISFKATVGEHVFGYLPFLVRTANDFKKNHK